MMEKLKKVSPQTWARTLILLVTLINEFLNVTGVNPIPLAEDSVYELFSMLAVGLSAVWAWWKNNSFTAAAIEADKVLEEAKEGE